MFEALLRWVSYTARDLYETKKQKLNYKHTPSKSPPKNETPIFLKILKPAFLSDLQNLVLVDLAHWKKTNLKESVTSTTVIFVLT